MSCASDTPTPNPSPYSPRGATIRAAIELASDVGGLRLVPSTAIGERYRVKLADERHHVPVLRGSARCAKP